MTPLVERLTDRLMDKRILVLGEEVSDDSAGRLISQMMVLSSDDPVSDICLYINSPGGSVLAGLAVYDVMQLLPNDVATVAVGLAASMAQVLLCAGTADKRFALPNAQVLMHEGSAGLGGAATDVAIQAAHLRDTLAQMRSIVTHHTGRSIEQISADMGRDRWFNAESARDYGFVDHVVSSLDEISPIPRVRQFGMTSPRTTGGSR